MLKSDFIRNAQLLLQDEYEAFETALNTDPVVSLRINPTKSGSHHLRNAAGSKKIPWCETGYYLSQRPLFISDPLFHAGTYYVQEAASMFLEQAIKTILLDDPEISKKGMTTLDLCAAPGGKSTHLLDLIPENSLLVCNEIIRNRCAILEENMAKWGRVNTIITQSDPQQFGRMPHFFDVIVADLPCSGEGMFRKDHAARKEWSMDHVHFCASRQRRIIRDVWNALKPGGYLIYSTCTFNTEENEDNITMLADELDAEIIPVTIKREWNISCGWVHHDNAGKLTEKPEETRGGELPVYRFFPHRTRSEGFFLALMRKTGANQHESKILTTSKTNSRKNKHTQTVPSHIKDMLLNPEKYAFRFLNTSSNAGKRILKDTSHIYAIPLQHENALSTLAEGIHIISAGLPLGELNNNDLSPSASLALSTALNIHTWPTVDLSCEQAISYLKKETIPLPANTPKRRILVTFRNIPLGFVKNIGARVNNLYPCNWRIRQVR